MPGKIYVCKQCKHGFYYKAKLSEAKTCESCQQATVETLEDWEEFECPVCKKKYDVLTLQMMGDSNSIEEGTLPCKIDKNIITWVPFSDDDGILTQEFSEDKEAWDEVLRQKFEEEKKVEDEREAAIILATMKPHKDRKRPYLRLSTVQEGEPTPEPLDRVQERQELDKNRQKRAKEESERIKKAKKAEEERIKKQQKEEEKLKKQKAAEEEKLKKVKAAEEEKLKKLKTEQEAQAKRAEEAELLEKLQQEKEEQLKIAQEQERLEKLKAEEEARRIQQLTEESEIEPAETPEPMVSPATEPAPIVEPTETAEPALEISAESIIQPTTEIEIETPVEAEAAPDVKNPEEAPAALEIPIENEPTPSLTTSEETPIEEANISKPPTKPETIATALATAASVLNTQEASESQTGEIETVAEGDAVEKAAEAGVVVEEIIEIPAAEEFWDYYYNQKKFYDAETYLGGDRVKEKILSLLQEVNYYLFNPADIDISRPIVDEQNSGRVYFVGDTHGSVIDTDTLIRFFMDRIQEAEEKKEGLHIIFDGDYVDRSPVDIHNLMYILSFALKNRKYVRLLRGNHEEITINSNYGFLRNLEIRIGDKDLVVEIERTFANIPLVHYLKCKDGKNVITLHGGIPIYDMDPSEMPEIPNLVDGLDRLDSRFVKIDDMDELSQQILWNDPAIDLPSDVFFLPSRRGLGFNFGEDVFKEWMEVNKADRLIRAHEVFLEGHMEYFNDRLFSLFSSSDYAGRKISAKILEFDLSKPWESNWRHLTILKDLTKDGAVPNPFASPF